MEESQDDVGGMDWGSGGRDEGWREGGMRGESEGWRGEGQGMKG